MRCQCQQPGHCPIRGIQVSPYDISVCVPYSPLPKEVKKVPVSCKCLSAGYCSVFDREMSESEWNACCRAIHSVKEDYYKSWCREKRTKSGTISGCVFSDGAALDEFGNQKTRRTCGCGGLRTIEPLITCLHPSHEDPMPDNCYERCNHFSPI